MNRAIALDCMGGDHSPAAQVEGAVRAVREASIPVILVGDGEQIRGELRRLNAENLAIEIRETSEVVTGEDQPTTVVRRKKDSSLVVAHQMVKDGQAGAALSSGNTGALLAAGLFVIGRMPGVERPALAPILPTGDGVGFLLLDAGATAEGKPDYILQYAVMGSMYRKLVHKIENPRVGLLNVGTEDGKGNELYRHAFTLLKEAPINFVGNVEARDLLDGIADVVVCDGFTGNILLKCVEGAGGFFVRLLKEEIKSDARGMVGGMIAAPSLKRLQKRLDYSEYGAAPMLGLNGVAFKAHGSANALAIYQALKIAHEFIESNMVERLASVLSELAEAKKEGSQDGSQAEEE